MSSLAPVRLLLIRPYRIAAEAAAQVAETKNPRQRRRNPSRSCFGGCKAESRALQAANGNALTNLPCGLQHQAAVARAAPSKIVASRVQWQNSFSSMSVQFRSIQGSTATCRSNPGPITALPNRSIRCRLWPPPGRIEEKDPADRPALRKARGTAGEEAQSSAQAEATQIGRPQ
jgi:hypothetical protein